MLFTFRRTIVIESCSRIDSSQSEVQTMLWYHLDQSIAGQVQCFPRIALYLRLLCRNWISFHLWWAAQLSHLLFCELLSVHESFHLHLALYKPTWFTLLPTSEINPICCFQQVSQLNWESMMYSVIAPTLLHLLGAVACIVHCSSFSNLYWFLRLTHLGRWLTTIL